MRSFAAFSVFGLVTTFICGCGADEYAPQIVTAQEQSITVISGGKACSASPCTIRTVLEMDVIAATCKGARLQVTPATEYEYKDPSSWPSIGIFTSEESLMFFECERHGAIVQCGMMKAGPAKAFAK